MFFSFSLWLRISFHIVSFPRPLFLAPSLFHVSKFISSLYTSHHFPMDTFRAVLRFLLISVLAIWEFWVDIAQYHNKLSINVCLSGSLHLCHVFSSIFREIGARFLLLLHGNVNLENCQLAFITMTHR